MGTKVIFLTGTLFLAVFLIGCSSSDSDPGAPALSLPAIPGSLTVETLSASSVTASWQDNSDNEAGFQIEYSPDNSFITFFGQNLGANLSSLVIEGLDPSTEYFSESMRITKMAIPAIPTSATPRQTTCLQILPSHLFLWNYQ